MNTANATYERTFTLSIVHDLECCCHVFGCHDSHGSVEVVHVIDTMSVAHILVHLAATVVGGHI